MAAVEAAGAEGGHQTLTVAACGERRGQLGATL
jgi:hypothetical protein